MCLYFFRQNLFPLLDLSPGLSFPVPKHGVFFSMWQHIREIFFTLSCLNENKTTTCLFIFVTGAVLMGDGDWLMWVLNDAMTEQLGFCHQETQQNNEQTNGWRQIWTWDEVDCKKGAGFKQTKLTYLHSATSWYIDHVAIRLWKITRCKCPLKHIQDGLQSSGRASGCLNHICKCYIFFKCKWNSFYKWDNKADLRKCIKRQV